MFDHPLQVSAILKLNPPVETLEALDVMVSKGLPSACVDNLYISIFQDRKGLQLFRGMLAPEANNLGSVQSLSLLTSQRVERLARTLTLANYVFDDLVDAREFLTNTHRALNDQSPLHISLTELGAIRVAQLLYQLYFGVLPRISE